MAKKIYINPGHSNVDPGAIGYEVERELNIKVSNYQKDYLIKNHVCEIRMSSGDMTKLNSITKDANNWGADLFVSNHFNAGGGDGFEVLVYSNNRKELGEVFNKHVKAIGQNSRGIKIRPDLAVLRDTAMPAVLTEGAFVDNLKDIRDWNEEHELKKLGEAYGKAAAEYLNLPYKVFKPYTVRIDVDALNVRSGPSINHPVTQVIFNKGVYTIVEESENGWGRLKSGAGWINLKYTIKF